MFDFMGFSVLIICFNIQLETLSNIKVPEGEETLRPPRSDLRSPGIISRLDEPPRSRLEFSQKVRERTTWGDQALVNKARTSFSKVVFIP